MPGVVDGPLRTGIAREQQVVGLENLVHDRRVQREGPSPIRGANDAGLTDWDPLSLRLRRARIRQGGWFPRLEHEATSPREAEPYLTHRALGYHVFTEPEQRLLRVGVDACLDVASADTTK